MNRLQNIIESIGTMDMEYLGKKDADAARLELEQLVRERDEAREKYQWMVNHVADQKLDGYRELGARAAQAEAKRDEALARVAELEAEVERLTARVAELEVKVEAAELRMEGS